MLTLSKNIRIAFITYAQSSPGAQDDQQFMLGRSTGKKFKESGVSLPEDKEISTTHSKVNIILGSSGTYLSKDVHS